MIPTYLQLLLLSKASHNPLILRELLPTRLAPLTMVITLHFLHLNTVIILHFGGSKKTK